jgi:hypothetical protein
MKRVSGVKLGELTIWDTMSSNRRINKTLDLTNFGFSNSGSNSFAQDSNFTCRTLASNVIQNNPAGSSIAGIYLT